MGTDGTQLATLPDERIREIVVSLPTNKRAAFSKALKAAVQHLRDARAQYDDVFPKAALIVENWWMLGKELSRIEFNRGGRPTKTPAPGQGLTLGDLGINYKQSERCQKLAVMTESGLAEWIQTFYNPSKFTYPTLKAGAEKVSENSGEPEWYTPSDFINAARSVLGEIDLDPASSDTAQETVQAKKYYTVDDDGLSKDWRGRVWMNPPYDSARVGKFMTKMADHVDAGDVMAAITLTNNSTDTAWFKRASESSTALCLVHKRIKFIDEDGNASGAPLQGQALLCFGDVRKKFVKAFGVFGVCWVRA